MHIAVDATTQEVMATVVTTNDVGDTEAFNDLMNQLQDDMDSVAQMVPMIRKMFIKRAIPETLKH